MSKRSFTLVELLVVMAIIGILSGLVIGGASFAARYVAETQTRTLLQKMVIALDQYEQDRGFFPQYSSPAPFKLAPAVGPNETGGVKDSETNRYYLEGYTGGVYRDAWDESFFYQCPGKMNPGSYDLWSMGRDGKHGDGTTDPTDAQKRGAEDSDDITNWKLN